MNRAHDMGEQRTAPAPVIAMRCGYEKPIVEPIGDGSCAHTGEGDHAVRRMETT
jgi:hypothetical protein